MRLLLRVSCAHQSPGLPNRQAGPPEGCPTERAQQTQGGLSGLKNGAKGGRLARQTHQNALSARLLEGDPSLVDLKSQAS